MDTSRQRFVLEVNKFVEEFFAEFGYPKGLVEKTKYMIDYTLPSQSKTILPLFILKMCKLIKHNLSDEELQMAESIGWIYQMFEAVLLVSDDYFDEGDMRYGKTSWPKLQKYSKSVIEYDVPLLKAISLYTLQKMFSHSLPMYLQLVDLFSYNDNSWLKGCLLESQHLIQNVRDGKIDLKSFNKETYNILGRLKSGSFAILAVGLALTVTGFRIEDNRELFENMKSICSDFGTIVYVYDDYYDIYSRTGEIACNSDIRRGQFTFWFLLAMERCENNDQVQELIKKYGKDDDESVMFFKRRYEELGIHELLEKHCDEIYNKIMKNIDVFFKESKMAHELMTWFISNTMKFLKEGGLGLF